MTPGQVWGMNLKCLWITFGFKNLTFPEHFLRVAGFGQMTHLNLQVGNDTWTSLGDEFEVPVDHFWGEKPLLNSPDKMTIMMSYQSHFLGGAV